MNRRFPVDRRYYSLDHWRGLACLMIVVYHAAYYVIDNPANTAHGVVGRIFNVVRTMDAGVPIFFVISGYCIAAACDKLRERSGGVKSYFLRRFQRIFPPFWVATGLCVLITLPIAVAGFTSVYADNIHPIADPRTVSPGWWIGSLTLTGTWGASVFGIHHWFPGLILGPSWTLCYEEQFYIVSGIALFASPKKFFRSMAAITAVVLIVATYKLHRPLPIDGFFFDGRWLIFAAGVGVYYRIHYARQQQALLLNFVLAAFVLFGAGVFHFRPQPITREFCEGAVFAVVVLLLWRWDAAIRSSRLLTPLSLVGTMCYSLYLVHWPIVKIISHLLSSSRLGTPLATLLVIIPVCVTLSIAAGWVFHLLVERRFMTAAQPRLRMDDYRTTTPAERPNFDKAA